MVLVESDDRPTTITHTAAASRRCRYTHRIWKHKGKTFIAMFTSLSTLGPFKRQPINTWQSVVMQMVIDDNIFELKLVFLLTSYFCLWMFVLVCPCCSMELLKQKLSELMGYL